MPFGNARRQRGRRVPATGVRSTRKQARARAKVPAMMLPGGLQQVGIHPRVLPSPRTRDAPSWVPSRRMPMTTSAPRSLHLAAPSTLARCLGRQLSRATTVFRRHVVSSRLPRSPRGKPLVMAMPCGTAIRSRRRRRPSPAGEGHSSAAVAVFMPTWSRRGRGSGPKQGIRP